MFYKRPLLPAILDYNREIKIQDESLISKRPCTYIEQIENDGFVRHYLLPTNIPNEET